MHGGRFGGRHAAGTVAARWQGGGREVAGRWQGGLNFREVAGMVGGAVGVHGGGACLLMHREEVGRRRRLLQRVDAAHTGWGKG